jgi:hypothetical protein
MDNRFGNYNVRSVCRSSSLKKVLVARYGRGEKCVQGFDGKARRKSPLERPRRRWEDGIKMDLTDIGWGVWSGFTWLRIGIVGGLL